ncbi:hypothetical protein LIS04_32 [Listeria phage LIS04]|nr:hypothetical protein LIS04_32 [Listeria phage LIS04]
MSRLKKICEDNDINLSKLTKDLAIEIVRESQVNWSSYYDEVNQQITLDDQSIFDQAFSEVVQYLDADLTTRDHELLYEYLYEKIPSSTYEIAYENIKELSSEYTSFSKDSYRHNGISRDDFI